MDYKQQIDIDIYIEPIYPVLTKYNLFRTVPKVSVKQSVKQIKTKTTTIIITTAITTAIDSIKIYKSLYRASREILLGGGSLTSIYYLVRSAAPIVACIKNCVMEHKNTYKTAIFAAFLTLASPHYATLFATTVISSLFNKAINTTWMFAALGILLLPLPTAAAQNQQNSDDRVLDIGPCHRFITAGPGGIGR